MSGPQEELAGRPRWSQVDLQSVIQRDNTPEPLAEGSEPVDPNVGRLFGKYRLTRRLGWGGMANVYLAHVDGAPDHEVAIKVLKPAAALSQATISRFIKEGQAISVIRHPNVIQLVEPPARSDDGQVYLVMELLTGKPLSEIISEMFAAGQVFTWPRLAPIVLQICRALQAAHKHKIVHRDMKPSNCFCTELDDEPWHIKVLDFGIAKVQSSGVSADSIETPLTQDGMFVGTPHYAAPEIIERRPENTIDGRADIFSLGVMMYQCLCGELPFEKHRKDVLAALYATARERPEPPRTRPRGREIPPEVEAIVMRAMEIEVDRRYANIGELAAAIRSTLRPTQTNEGPSESTPPSLTSTAPVTGRAEAESTNPGASRAETTPSTARGAEATSMSRGAAASLSASRSGAASSSSASRSGAATPPNASIGTSVSPEAGVTRAAAPPGEPVEVAAATPASRPAIKPLILAGLMIAGLLAIVTLLVVEARGGSQANTGAKAGPRASRPAR
ncbi:MAG: serine/threonine protein kinase [Myxococcales bacterium]|nr:serine/threonine protein kinase [Myxococcales bacterium]